MTQASNMYQLAIVEGLLPSDSCFSLGYMGTFGNQSLYLPSVECAFGGAAGLDLDVENFVAVPRDASFLYWVGEIATEEELLPKVDYVNTWNYLDAALDVGTMDDNQHVMTSYRSSVLYRTPSSSLIAVFGHDSKQFAIDTVLQQHHKAYAITYPPAPLVPVPAGDVARVELLLKDLNYSDAIASLVNSLSIAQMHDDITWLTGEAVDSPIESRHSFHPDARKAASWILKQMESTGATCDLRPFLTGFTPNVICRYNGTDNSTALVLLSAHYDSRGSFGSTRAPGGDDDGSGTTAILAIARAIGKSGITFKSNVELCLFAGEEQGLLGSKAYASELKEANANITLMIQADMLAYHKPGEPPQLGLPDVIGTPAVTQLVANISSLYSPELVVGYTPACCSDHQSFHEQGFASTQVFERAGPIADPMYHNSGDLSNREGYDFRQLKSIAKVQFATLLHAAGFNGAKQVQ